MGSDRHMERTYLGSGGAGSVGWGDSNATTSPKRKTLEFEHLTCSYSFETKVFTVEGPDGSMDFGPDELSELRAAMTTFGIGLTPPGSGVYCR